MSSTKPTEKISAILLAAGLSRRMGAKNKLLLPFRKSTILQTTIDHLIKSQVHNVIVVIGHDEDNIRKQISEQNVQIAVNDQYKSGMVSSIKKGLSVLNQDTSFMIALGDMPVIQPENYDELISFYLDMRMKGKKIVRPRSSESIPGNPVIFHHSLRQDMMNNSDPDSAQTVIKTHKSDFTFFQSNRECFYSDIDSPMDYGRLSTSG